MAIIDAVVSSSSDVRQRTCVVIGGRGLLGKLLVRRLLKLGNWIVRVADSSSSSSSHSDDDVDECDSLLAKAIADGSASYSQCDVRDKSQIVKVVEGSSVVFYMEPKDYPDDFYSCYMIIVQGSKNVIAACQECRVRRLIYNSTADIISGGSNDIVNGNETFSCDWMFWDMLTDLRAHAEALVLVANNIDGLLTCALRPSNLFGPGYSQFVPLLVKLAKSGWAKFIIGKGENLADFTYVENVCHAHICAAEALDSRTSFVAGKTFFITNLEPMKFWEFVSLLLEGLGYQRPVINIPSRLVLYILLILKVTCETLGLRIPKFRFSPHFFVQLASRTRTFDCTSAEEYLGYTPSIPLEEGIQSTIESFSHLAKGSSLTRYREFPEKSKIDKILGSGKVADILLWRDEKETFALFLELAMLFYWFFLCERTFASSATKLLLLVTVVLYGHAFLPSDMYVCVDVKSLNVYYVFPLLYPSILAVKRVSGFANLCFSLFCEQYPGASFQFSSCHHLSAFLPDIDFLVAKTNQKGSFMIAAMFHRFGYTVQKMSASNFELTETGVRGSFRRVAFMWNRGVNKNIKSMAKGEDWNNFFKVAASLYFLKWILAQSLTVAVGVALVFAFTAFFVYEQFEADIDQLAASLFSRMKTLPAFVLAFVQNSGAFHDQHRTPNTIQDHKKMASEL
ncbi:hypothetical protein ACFE04_004157 [Oxalis oulophora]